MSAGAASTNEPAKRLYLLYHELRSQPSRYAYALACAEFDKQMELFARLQHAPSSEMLRPEITFDDGHLSDYEHALPTLARHSLVATFFITAGWTGRKTGYMNLEQLRSLAQSRQRIGAHGMTHALLTHCTAKELDKELRGARQMLEDGLGTPVTTMSLPGGRYNREVLAACRRAGYTQVYTSHPRAESMPLGELVGRFNIRGEVELSWIERLLQPQSGTLARLERSDRIKCAVRSALGDRLYGRLWAIVNRQESEPEAGESLA